MCLYCSMSSVVKCKQWIFFKAERFLRRFCSSINKTKSLNWHVPFFRTRILTWTKSHRQQIWIRIRQKRLGSFRILIHNTAGRIINLCLQLYTRICTMLSQLFEGKLAKKRRENFQEYVMLEAGSIMSRGICFTQEENCFQK